MNHLSEGHRGGREGWLRAAVLGANDGILSTAGIVVGVAAADTSHAAIVTAGIAGVVAGALSMAAGEYVSVSSQSDVERSDLELERRELADDPEGELAELAAIYERRGLDERLAREVAERLTAHDALGAHARDELGLAEHRMARPFQAAWASALAFVTGAVVPLAAIWLAPAGLRVTITALVTLVALGLLGAVGARLGGASQLTGAVRVMVWGTLAMLVTGVIGALTGAVL
ncbi:MAG TPA: VIT family protein [Miltoncostaeaceae bacterium]|mgnify:FL=1|nr:VIT family protein [Miltoncostaeaceae bacterium]